MDMNAWIDSLMSSRSALPVMTYPGLSGTGGNVGEFVTDGAKQFESIDYLARRYNPPAIVGAMDLSVEAEAFGCPVKFADDEVPTVTDRIVTDMTSAEDLEIPSLDTGRIGEYLKANRLCVSAYPDKPVLGGMIGPFSLAGRLMGMTEIMMDIIMEPEKVETVLEKTTSFLIEYGRAIKATGAGGVIVAEPAAGLISPDMCDEFSSTYMKRIVDAVQDDSFIVILHNCGRTTKQVQTMLSTGARALHFGNAVNMTDILVQMPENVPAMGYIDPANVLKVGTAEQVKAKTLELLQATAQYKNFVLSSGCDIPHGTPLENIDAFYEALKEYNDSLK